MAELRTNAAGTQLCTSADGTFLITSEDDSCVCGTVCPWYWRAKLCRAGACPAAGFVYVCNDATCLDGTAMVAGTVFRFGGHCYAVETHCKYWQPPQVEPTGECVQMVPPESIIVEGSRECVPNCDDPKCNPVHTHYPLVLCSCSTDGTLTNAWMKCEDYWAAVNAGCTCPTALVFQGGVLMCATADTNNPGVPGQGALIASPPFKRSCCQCCATLSGNPCVHFPLSSCGKVPFDPFGLAAYAGKPPAQIGRCCCGPERTWTIEGSVFFRREPFFGEEERTWTFLGAGITTTAGSIHFTDSAFGEYDQAARGDECVPQLDSVSGEVNRLMAISRLSGPVLIIDLRIGAATCERYVAHMKAQAFQRPEDGGRLIATTQTTLIMTLDRQAGDCESDGCGKVVPPVIDPDGNPMPGQDPRPEWQKARESGQQGCCG